MTAYTETINYGEEEGNFYMHQWRRVQPFERTNHFHSTYEIYYLISGRRDYFIKERSYQVQAGDLIFINKYDVHKSSITGKPEHERLVINFSDAFLGTNHPFYRPELFRVFQQEGALFRLTTEQISFVMGIFGKMIHEIKEARAGFETYLRVLLTELLLFAERLNEAAEGEKIDQEPMSPMHKKIAGVVKHIHLHYHEPVTLTDLSEWFGMSPSYLSRTFKAVTGFTLIGYVNLIRTREAERLLLETRHSIIEVAAAAGFEHFTHFNRTFKSLTGTTPSKYRKGT
ncbi:AraC family transcriptional regulator [Gorillibacterium massiliense]|uniref:AraC family transcriptional regulator n=1 Tax=Gorillibacterium massiliense TaxID=1280390 RepID=UPI0004AF625D|nr:AraC family transcriptional regulator [Gorillibacterium massiliense]